NRAGVEQQLLRQRRLASVRVGNNRERAASRDLSLELGEGRGRLERLRLLRNRLWTGTHSLRVLCRADPVVFSISPCPFNGSNRAMLSEPARWNEGCTRAGWTVLARTAARRTVPTVCRGPVKKHARHR